jgi:hypothetical protein
LVCYNIYQIFPCRILPQSKEIPLQLWMQALTLMENSVLLQSVNILKVNTIPRSLMGNIVSDRSGAIHFVFIEWPHLSPLTMSFANLLPDLPPHFQKHLPQIYPAACETTTPVTLLTSPHLQVASSHSGRQFHVRPVRWHISNSLPVARCFLRQSVYRTFSTVAAGGNSHY